MNKKIMVIVQPFAIAQQVIYIYEDGNKTGTLYTTLKEIPDLVTKLSNEYEIYNIELVGPKLFLQATAQDILEAERLKYDENKITVEIIRGV